MILAFSRERSTQPPADMDGGLERPQVHNFSRAQMREARRRTGATNGSRVRAPRARRERARASVSRSSAPEAPMLVSNPELPGCVRDERPSLRTRCLCRATPKSTSKRRSRISCGRAHDTTTCLWTRRAGPQTPRGNEALACADYRGRGRSRGPAPAAANRRLGRPQTHLGRVASRVPDHLM